MKAASDAGSEEDPLFAELGQLGIRPRRRNVHDPLERHRAIPLHAVFLYTTEDESVERYISQNWSALDAISGDLCDIYPSLSQFHNEEDAYTFIDELKVIEGATFRDYSELPGMLFWDQKGGWAFASFGTNADTPSIRLAIRTIFTELYRQPTIASVIRAVRELDAKANPKERTLTNSDSLRSNAITVCLVLIVVFVLLIIAALLVNPIVLGVVLIAGLLIFVVTSTVLLRLAGVLSEPHLVHIIDGILAKLPLLRGGGSDDQATRREQKTDANS